jgi:CDP-diacylglycerol--glycerol-3-phosphate 3-phosphatidyltransferase
MSAGRSTHPSPLTTLPNQLTTLRLVLSFVLFGLIAAGWWRSAIVVFAAAAVSDWLDGYFARRDGLVSSFGRMYDPLVDKVLVSGAFIFLLPFAGANLAPWMVTVLVAREFLVTGIRGYLEEIGVSFGADRWGKLKMVLQCAALLWLFVLFDQGWDAGDADWPRWVRDGLNLSAVLATLLSGLNYFFRSLPYLTGRASSGDD